MVYGGVSVFVVAFAANPFAGPSCFATPNIPKRLIPDDALARYLAMERLPGSPQIQNSHPTTFRYRPHGHAAARTIGGVSFRAAA